MTRRRRRSDIRSLTIGGAHIRRFIGGFAVLPKGHKDFRDIWDDSTESDYGANLRDLLAPKKPSKIRPTMLRKHEWKLTEIQSVEDDDSELTVKTKEAAAKEHPIPPGPRRDQNAVVSRSSTHPRGIKRQISVR
ncbi:hypothetical protein LTR37_004250 [Vermiconidia calcicola]|uniref:Uncharacterized protein n=1 Tax=Vermiconidia calcicola TaxID=1690605 RepID=A0ACC3NN70_9PEZI|nr:hypothetical protein LTR37_004250 [Vermiconidia calcicola]